MVNSPLTKPTLLQKLHLASSLLLFCGFARLFFHENYFTSSTATGSTVAMAISVAGKKETEGAKRKKERKREKVFRVDREITGFIIFSQLILSISGDRAKAARRESLCLCLSSNKLLLGSGPCRPHSLIKWDQTYIPLTSSSLLLRNLKVQRQIP